MCHFDTNMVLSWTDSPYQMSAHVFNGGGEVKIFIFYFMIAEMKTKEPRQYSSEYTY